MATERAMLLCKSSGKAKAASVRLACWARRAPMSPSIVMWPKAMRLGAKCCRAADSKYMRDMSMSPSSSRLSATQCCAGASPAEHRSSW